MMLDPDKVRQISGIFRQRYTYENTQGCLLSQNLICREASFSKQLQTVAYIIKGKSGSLTTSYKGVSAES